MPYVAGLRSGYSLVGRLVHFGRMLDKIRLHAANRLPADYHGNLGTGFDGRTCSFLGISYEALKARTLEGGCDEDILAWAHRHGCTRTDEECLILNRFLMKIGWRDDRSALLKQRIAACGLEGKPIETFFDLNEFDEGRNPVSHRVWELNEPRVIIVMGVAGSGKTTVGRSLATLLGWRFIDADDHHPPGNIAKITQGIPLADTDRAPWLDTLRAEIDARLAARENTVLACSALKQTYRDQLMADPGCVKLAYLRGTREQLTARLMARTGHFASVALLESQLATLEAPRHAFTLDIDVAPEVLAEAIRRHYGL